jgi:hypothetical protein
MGFFSDLFSDDPIEKLTAWRDELVKVLPDILDEEDDFVVDEDGDVQILKGSARVFVEFIVDEDGQGFVVIGSPLVHLPKENLLPFYRRLLDLNSDPLRFGALATREDFVVLTRTIPINGLEEEAFLFNVHVLCLEADDLDDALINEFDAPRFDLESG